MTLEITAADIAQAVENAAALQPNSLLSCSCVIYCAARRQFPEATRIIAGTTDLFVDRKEFRPKTEDDYIAFVYITEKHHTEWGSIKPQSIELQAKE